MASSKGGTSLEFTRDEDGMYVCSRSTKGIDQKNGGRHKDKPYKRKYRGHACASKGRH